jgi:hypothetical protein
MKLSVPIDQDGNNLEHPNILEPDTLVWAKKPGFHFLLLPPEIRNQLFFLCLQTPEEYVHIKHSLYEPGKVSYYYGFYPWREIYPPSPNTYQLSPALLRCSKQIYLEGIGILYNMKFIFGGLRVIRKLMLQIGPRNSRYIKDIELLFIEEPGVPDHQHQWKDRGILVLMPEDPLRYLTNIHSFAILTDDIASRGNNSRLHNTTEPRAIATNLFLILYGWFSAMLKAHGSSNTTIKALKIGAWKVIRNSIWVSPLLKATISNIPTFLMNLPGASLIEIVPCSFLMS